MKTEYDKEIESFFAQLKEKDRGIEIPDFPEPLRRKKVNWGLAVGIAASFVLGYFLLPQNRQESNSPADMIIITLENDANNNQQIMIEEKTYLEIWESPTSSLLTEY